MKQGEGGNISIENVKLSKLAEFDHVTQWRKDEWQSATTGYPETVLNYLECSKILNAED